MTRALIYLIFVVAAATAHAIAPLYISITANRSDTGEFIQLSGSTSERDSSEYYYFKDVFAGYDYDSYFGTGAVHYSASADGDNQIRIGYSGARGASTDVINIQGKEPPLFIGKLYTLTNTVITWSTNTMWTRVGNATRHPVVAREYDKSKSHDIPCGAGKNLLLRDCVITVNSDISDGAQLYLRHTETGRIFSGRSWHLGSDWGIGIKIPEFGRFTVHEVSPEVEEDVPMFGDLNTNNGQILHGAEGSILYGDTAKWFSTNFNVWVEWVFNKDYDGYLKAHINDENVCDSHSTSHIIKHDITIGNADYVIENSMVECYFTLSLKISEGAPCTPEENCTYRVWLNAETYDQAIVNEKASYSGSVASVAKFKLTYNSLNKTWALKVCE